MCFVYLNHNISIKYKENTPSSEKVNLISDYLLILSENNIFCDSMFS